LFASHCISCYALLILQTGNICRAVIILGIFSDVYIYILICLILQSTFCLSFIFFTQKQCKSMIHSKSVFSVLSNAVRWISNMVYNNYCTGNKAILDIYIYIYIYTHTQGITYYWLFTLLFLRPEMLISYISKT